MRRGTRFLPLLLLMAGVPAAAQSVTGRVVDQEFGRGVAGVHVSLLNAAGVRLTTALTDTAGQFRLAGRGEGRYTLETSHIGFAPYRSEPFHVGYMEAVVMTVLIARTAIPLDPITITARSRLNRHAPSYEGLYARLDQLPAVGSNRIVMKGDVELLSTMQVLDVLERFFYPVYRKGGICYYWNGHPVPDRMAPLWLTRSVDELEAIEVYGDYLMAPLPFWDPPSDRPLATTCRGVVALWALRPDLPGRKR